MCGQRIDSTGELDELVAVLSIRISTHSNFGAAS
jgi:hypothetical protein